MRGEMSGRRRRAREGAHPLVRNRARAGDDAPIARPAPKMQVRLGGFGPGKGGVPLATDGRLELDLLGPAVFLQQALDGPLPAELGGDHAAASAEAAVQLIVLEQ